METRSSNASPNLILHHLQDNAYNSDALQLDVFDSDWNEDYGRLTR